MAICRDPETPLVVGFEVGAPVMLPTDVPLGSCWKATELYLTGSDSFSIIPPKHNPFCSRRVIIISSQFVSMPRKHKEHADLRHLVIWMGEGDWSRLVPQWPQVVLAPNL